MSNPEIGAALLVSMIIAFICGFSISLDQPNKTQEIQQQAIENNCAYYSPKTGEFTWGSVK